MRIKNLLILIIIFVAVSIAAYSYSKGNTVQVTDDISLEDVEDCETFYWDEITPIYGTCIRYYNATACDDEPFNTSCYMDEKIEGYTCRTG